MVIRVMEETAQVNISCNFIFAVIDLFILVFSPSGIIDTEIHLLSSITDIDECANPETNQCDPDALCNNTVGSYICRCLIGYQGDGRNCIGK